MITFNIDKQHKYVIYGAGGNCYRLLELFKEAGCCVTAIIDKRAESLVEINQVPVYTMEDFFCEDKKNIVVVVSIKNVFEHTNVACELLNKGYSNLIYKPEPTLRGIKDEIWDSVNNAHDCLVGKYSFPCETESAVAVSDIGHMREYRNRLLIEAKEDKVVCWLPMELIFNYDRDELFGRQHMMGFYPLINLYKYLLGYSQMYSWNQVRDDYLLYSADWVYKMDLSYDDSLRYSLIESRINVFKEMQQNFEIDQNFFVRSAVEVSLKDNLRFCLSSSGRNRVAFLLAKGYRYIPVVMSKQDYEMWYNASDYEILKEEFQRTQEVLFSTIPHPMMREYPVSVSDYERLWCMPVLSDVFRCLHWESVQDDFGYLKVNKEKFLERKNCTKVACLIQDDGKISRSFAMAGFQCYRVCADDNNSNERERKIDLLVKNAENPFIKYGELDILKKCNILVLDSNYNEIAVEHFKGDRIYIIDSREDQSVLTYWSMHGFICKSHMFSSVWNGTPVSGYLLIKE